MEWTKKDRKAYTNNKLDYTCIEIYDEDKINQFFKIDNQIFRYPIKVFKDKDIFQKIF